MIEDTKEAAKAFADGCIAEMGVWLYDPKFNRFLRDYIASQQSGESPLNA